MKRSCIITLIISLAAILSVAPCASAQETAPEGYEYVDSVVYRPAAAVDSSLVGQDIFRSVSVSQSEMVERSVKKHIESNAKRTINGYRVRIFFDNRQTARSESEQTIKKFVNMFHDVSAYRTYTNPYFKVTVGDCRTKSEAMALLARIKGAFPSAFVVKENINYPIVDKDNAYVVDTVKVLRPKK